MSNSWSLSGGTLAKTLVILVIEDDPGDARLIQRQLELPGPSEFKVHLVRSLRAAQAWIEAAEQAPDVVLLDLNLPDSSGVATVETCRTFVEAPIVVLTGWDDSEATLAAIQSGAEDYLTKGADAAALRRAVLYANLRHKRDSDAHLAATVFSHAREGILITSPEGVIRDVNTTFTHITGYAREEMIGHTPRMLKSGVQSSEFYQSLWKTLLQDGHWSGDLWNRRKDGSLYAESLTISAVYDRHRRVRHYVGLFSDVTQQKEQQQQLEHLAHFDALTGLPNRVLLADRLRQAMLQASRRRKRLAIAYIDLDGFKQINDLYGHQAGDFLLTQVSLRMRQSLRESDTLARLGGDEFVALMLDLEHEDASGPLLDRLLAAAASPLQVGECTLKVSASIGTTFYPQRQELEPDQLLRQADFAMYQAKLAGRNRYALFEPELELAPKISSAVPSGLRQALSHNELVLFYQPKVNLHTGAVIGAEALVRWAHPEQGLLPPSAFLPFIEDKFISVELGEWVIDTTLRQLEQWATLGISLPVSVNVGARQLQLPDFMERLKRILASHPRIRSELLELEIVETSALVDLPHVVKVMNACLELGIGFALDDFGTGYSSLAYLKQLPATWLKVDQSFVLDIEGSPEDLAILQGILGLARSLRRKVIAEGVETDAQGELLIQLGCPFGQGYGIARPMPADALPAWIRSWKPPAVWLDCPAPRPEFLPLIFASVEHRAWIRAVEACLIGARAVPPPMDIQGCQFGKWLTAEASSTFTNTSLVQEAGDLHQEIHVMANELLKLQAFDRLPHLDSSLQSLRDLRDALLVRLRSLIRSHTASTLGG